MPLATVAATLTDRNAPTRLRAAEMATAVNGLRAPVAIEVAIALAVSWKPLVKSKANAVMTTMARISRVAVTAEISFLYDGMALLRLPGSMQVRSAGNARRVCTV